MRTARCAVAVAVAAGLLALTSCGDEAAGSGGITVFAAASLTDAFTEIRTAFSDAHPDTP